MLRGKRSRDFSQTLAITPQPRNSWEASSGVSINFHLKALQFCERTTLIFTSLNETNKEEPFHRS